MAQSNRTAASYVAAERNTKEKKKNPFTGLTMAEMKKKYSSMTPAQRAANVQTFRDAAKTAPKSKPKTKPKQTSKKEAAKRFYSSSSQGSIQQNQDKAKSNFFRSSSGTRGENVKSNPALKSQPKKPSRSSFPAGRAGASKYAAALREYRSKTKRVNRNQLKPKYNRRGRRM